VKPSRVAGVEQRRKTLGRFGSALELEALRNGQFHKVGGNLVPVHTLRLHHVMSKRMLRNPHGLQDPRRNDSLRGLEWLQHQRAAAQISQRPGITVLLTPLDSHPFTVAS